MCIICRCETGQHNFHPYYKEMYPLEASRKEKGCISLDRIMKLKKLASSIVVSMMLLSGCGAKTGTTVASTTLGDITADSIYEKLTSTSSSDNDLFSYVLDQLIDTKYPVTSDMETNADTMIDNIKAAYESQYSTGYEDQLQTDLESSGYKSLDDYRERILYSLQYAEMMKDYVKANFDDVFDDYYKMAKPRKVSLIKVALTDTANPTAQEKAQLKEVQALIKEGKDFGDIAKDYSDDDATAGAKGDLGVVDEDSTIGDTYGEDVLTEAMSLTSGKVSKAILGTDGYYILKCTSTKKDDIKEELKTVDINSPLITYDDHMVYMVFKTYNIEFTDKDIKKSMDAFIKEQLDERAKERKS